MPYVQALSRLSLAFARDSRHFTASLLLPTPPSSQPKPKPKPKPKARAHPDQARRGGAAHARIYACMHSGGRVGLTWKSLTARRYIL
jgi:hypothetical protein